MSPYGGLGSTAALVFVLLVAGVKAVWEDVKRHQEDRETNKSITEVMQPDGGTPLLPSSTRWHVPQAVALAYAYSYLLPASSQ